MASLSRLSPWHDSWLQGENLILRKVGQLPAFPWNPWDSFKMAWLDKDIGVSRCWCTCWLWFLGRFFLDTWGLFQGSAFCFSGPACLSDSVRNCLTTLDVLLTGGQSSLSLYILCYTLALVLFPLQLGVLPLPPCDSIKTRAYFCCGKIHIFIGCRLEWALGVLLFLLCLVVVILCMVITKAKMCKIYVWILGRTWPSVQVSWEPVSSELGRLSHWP